MISWGIIGYGKMGSIFKEAVKETNSAKLLMIGSKTKQGNGVYNYESILDNDQIDAIYISTLNNTHNELIKQILKRGKKILCEKPLTTSLNKLDQIKNDLNNKNHYLYEAIAYYSHPQTIEILNLLNSNEIGDIVKVECNFGFKARVKKNSRLFDPNLGGGSLLDLGCYPISFLMLFCSSFDKFKLLNSKISYASTSVDDEAEAEFLCNDKFKANVKVSIKSNLENKCKIFGTRGEIIIDNPWLPENKGTITVTNNKHFYRKTIESKLSVYANQIENVSNIFLGNTINFNNMFDFNKSYTCMKLIELWKKK